MTEFNIHDWQGKMRRQMNEVSYKDFRGDTFSIKAISFTYTEQGGRFYGAYLYDVPKTANVGHRAKLGYKDAAALLSRIGVQGKLPGFYEDWAEDGKYDQSGAAKAGFVETGIIQQLQDKGIVVDVNDLMDVS